MAVSDRSDQPRRAEGGSRGPLARREFRLYFVGNLLSNSGTWLQNVALNVFMYNLTRSSFWVGMSGMALFLPVLLFALPAGVLADRADRLKLLLRSQIVSAALAALLTILVALDAANRYTVLAIAAGLGLAVAVGIPAMQSLIPSLVPHHELSDAIGLNALTFNVARFLGPIVATATITAVGVVWAFGINALSYAALILALVLIGRPPYQRPGSRPGPLRDGLAYAWRHLRTRTLLLSVVAIGISLDPILTLAPALVGSYGLSTGQAGWIVSAWGGGAVLAILLRPLMRAAVEHGFGWAGLLVQGAGVAALGAAPGIALALPAAVLTGAGYIVATIVFTTIIQSDVPEDLRGRVSALWTLAFLGPRTVASVVDGALGDAIGPHITTTLFSLPVLVAAWFARRVEPQHREPVPPPA